MTVRIGLIGLSGYARSAHIRNLLVMPERARITAVWNRGAERLNQALAIFAEATPGERSSVVPVVPAICDSWHALVQRNDVDAVIVTLPPDLNREIVSAALEAGKHVLVEKPLAHTLEDAQAIAAAAKKAPKLVVQVGLEVRHGWTHQKLKSLVREGVAGTPALLWITAIGGADWAYRPGWVTDPARTGGVFNVWGVHVLDLICDLAGGTPLRVSAIGGTFRRKDTPYPDGAHVLFDFGALKANLVYCRFAEVWRRDWAEITLAGDKARLEGFVSRREVLVTAADTGAGASNAPVSSVGYMGEPFESSGFDGCRQQLENFCTAIEKHSAPLVTVNDGLRATCVALAIEKSLRTGWVVELSQR